MPPATDQTCGDGPFPSDRVNCACPTRERWKGDGREGDPARWLGPLREAWGLRGWAFRGEQLSALRKPAQDPCGLAGPSGDPEEKEGQTPEPVPGEERGKRPVARGPTQGPRQSQPVCSFPPRGHPDKLAQTGGFKQQRYILMILDTTF